MPECNGNLTKYQPTAAEWKCPNCKAKAPIFHIDESYCDWDCKALHVDDYLICDKCNTDCSGEAFAIFLQKKSKRKKCPHCKGKGWL